MTRQEMFRTNIDQIRSRIDSIDTGLTTFAGLNGGKWDDVVYRRFEQFKDKQGASVNKTVTSLAALVSAVETLLARVDILSDMGIRISRLEENI